MIHTPKNFKLHIICSALEVENESSLGGSYNPNGLLFITIYDSHHKNLNLHM